MSGGEGAGNPFGEDYCEYVHNPLMRQYQAIIRLLQQLRQSQSDCNDLECFPNQNPLVNSSLSDQADATTSMFTYGTLFMIWMVFMAFLFMFRPSSMRGNRRSEKKDREPAMNGRFFRSQDNNDDDDDATVS